MILTGEEVIGTLKDLGEQWDVITLPTPLAPFWLVLM